MANVEAKKKAPSKPCPKCGKSIHARSKSHEECGWQDTSSSSSKAARATGKDISKMEGVRQALARLGDDSTPLEIKHYLKKQFNIDMKSTIISSYKTLILSRARKNGRQRAGAPVGRKAASGTISMEDILAVKALAARLGVERLQQLAKVLAK